MFSQVKVCPNRFEQLSSADQYHTQLVNFLPRLNQMDYWIRNFLRWQISTKITFIVPFCEPFLFPDSRVSQTSLGVPQISRKTKFSKLARQLLCTEVDSLDCIDLFACYFFVQKLLCCRKKFGGTIISYKGTFESKQIFLEVDNWNSVLKIFFGWV